MFLQRIGACVRLPFKGKARGLRVVVRTAQWCAAMQFAACGALAQNVITQHNDIARSGANNSETILTPSNVNATSFGKLFSQSVDGQMYAQPLYVSGVAISGKGTHNVVFVATENDSIYAFDADDNTGANASPLWQITLLDAAHGAASDATAVPSGDLSTADISPQIGITGTPVIDPATNTLYVAGKTKESGTYVQRLHAIDITSGSEKFGGPVALSASVPGNGNGSSGGTLNFDAKWENNRAGLLLLNGIVYLAFAAHGDNGAWHGWILSYDATTLRQTGAWCASPNGIGGGIWMSGAGLAADNNNPGGTSPGGRMFFATGNGTFDASQPYTNSMDYGDSIVRLDLNNGAMTVADAFTPSNQAELNSEDRDVAGGGVLLLPDQGAGGPAHLLVQLGKEGKIYVVDRDNMGGFNSSDAVVQEFFLNGGSGMFGMPAYGNNTVYIWGTNDNLKSFPLNAGQLPSTANTNSSQTVGFPSPTPAITTNGGSGAIVWTVETDSYNSGGSAVLRAHDAANVSNTLYSSSTNASSDAAGPAVKFVVPTATNGKVYVGTGNALAVYGLLNGKQQAAAPSLSPTGQSFTGALSVTITDSTPNASIFFSTSGTATTNSTRYTGPIAVKSSETVSAMATAPGFLPSLPASETYTLQTQAHTPTFSIIPGSYASPQTVTISDASPNATIYYAINGPASTSSRPFAGSATVTVSQSETINALATSPGLSTSQQASATYTIAPGATSPGPAGSVGGITFSNGFSTSASTMTFNGSTQLNDARLQLTDGLANEAGSAWFNTPVNIQSFANNFTFQLSNPMADGITFTIQNAGLTALGPLGGGLGYGPDSPGGSGGIPSSVAIKFDLYDNNGEGPDSVGLYTGGDSPTTPAVDMSASGLDLHSGNTISANMVYDGTTLTLTLTDGVANKGFQTGWTVNIPQIVGGNSAYVGFTGGTGGLAASQKILTWNFASTAAGNRAAATPAFSLPAGTYSGTQTVSLSDATANAAIFYTTDGSTPGTSAGGSTKQYSSTLSVGSSEVIRAIATASGFSPSSVASASYDITAQAATATPVIRPATGTYASAQSVSITDTTSGATIYYALNGPASTSSTKYVGPFIVSSTTTVNAIATAANFATSATASSAITIQTSTSSTPINFAAGFTSGGLQFNGHTQLNGTRLQLTDTATMAESSSAFWVTPVRVTSFTNDFTFQLTSPSADGFTFTIQGSGATALGPTGGGLGYGPDSPGGSGGVPNSVAVKFDLYDNAGEGANSTGLYTNGASPTMPATALGGNVDLHSGDTFHVVMSYDGTTLTMTITDMSNAAQTFTTSWPIDIASTVGGATAYVGFTGGTGGLHATQEILTWTYSATTSAAAPKPKTPVVYEAESLAGVSSGPTWRQFAWVGFPDQQGMILDGAGVGDNVTLTVNAPTAGIYDVKISMKELDTRGVWQLAINGTNVGTPVDEYQATGSGVYVTTDLGNFNFTSAGNYSFKFTIVGRNAASSGYLTSFDTITLTPQ
jgi:Legume lectin domain/Chitobiase/beta-hexosaminidase C-terminal domain